MNKEEAFEKFLKDNHYDCEEDELIEFELRQVEQAFEAGAKWKEKEILKKCVEWVKDSYIGYYRQETVYRFKEHIEDYLNKKEGNT